MNYTKSEINDLAFGRLTPEKLQQAVEAFHGFISLFGKSWLDKVFQEYEQQQGQFKRRLEELTDQGNDRERVTL